MSSLEGVKKRMLSPSMKTKGISRQNPRYRTSSKSKPLKELEKKTSGKGFSSRNQGSFADTESARSKGSNVFGGVSKVTSSFWRKSQSLVSGLARRAVSPGQADHFFFTNAENKWRAEVSSVFTCENKEDNIPQAIDFRGFSINISQNRLRGRKTMGQDCIGYACHKEWEVFVLCDGHDQDGHKVAQGVCATLPHFLLRRIFARKGYVGSVPERSLIIEAFKETEETVCWYKCDDIQQGEYVMITHGKFRGEIGYIADMQEDDEGEDVTVTVVVDNEAVGYHRVEVAEQHFRTPRYKGGSTCLCFMRNLKTNRCKVALLGDSRLMVTGDIGEKHSDEDFVDPVLLATYFLPDDDDDDDDDDDEPILLHNPNDSVAFFTPQHNVYNTNERERLKAYQKAKDGEYVVDLQEGYLVNPETKMQIQPTRGFGDVEMQNCGYSHIPDVSESFTLSPGSIVLGASDGVFDGELWENDEDFLEFVINKSRRNKQKDSSELAEQVYQETKNRCSDVDHLDDISLFTFFVPKAKMRRTRMKSKNKGKQKKPEAHLSEEVIRRQQNRRSMKSRRSTIQRIEGTGAHWFRKYFTRETKNLLP